MKKKKPKYRLTLSYIKTGNPIMSFDFIEKPAVTVTTNGDFCVSPKEPKEK